MQAPRWTHSLRWRIVASYSLILIAGGLSTSIIGIRVTGAALLRQAGQQVDHGLAAARMIYRSRLEAVRDCVEFLGATRRALSLATGQEPQARPEYAEYVAGIRQRRGLDFLSITDASGRVVLRTAGPGATGDDVSGLAPVRAALEGVVAASTEVVALATLAAEDPALAERVRIPVAAGAEAGAAAGGDLAAGMVLLAAAPILGDGRWLTPGAAGGGSRPVGVVYGGQLLNEAPDSEVRRYSGAEARVPAPEDRGIADLLRDTAFPGMYFQGRNAGAATIFQDDVRIATNVLDARNRRALGTRVAREVYEAVMRRGQTWSDRALAVSDWYITAYEPITNLAGERIGMLGVGLLQRPYTAVRDRVTLAFALIALFCFALIVAVTYFLTRSLVRPLEHMATVSKEIAAGRLNLRVQVADRSEVGLLASSFNAMLDRIHDMNMQIGQWAKMLEQKVHERTEQLARTQTALHRQQRLASLGQLAAGVAHEINNPLGGILTFATLVLEELPPDSPLRPDVEEIVRQADRCRRIVQELLEFSRQREARMAPHSVNEIVRRTLGMLEKQASFQNIQVVRELDPSEPVAIADDSQLQQVFINIILNAVDAMQERGTLAVTTGHDDASQEVFVRFTDNGCGIPPEIREAIFDPFFTTKAPGRGTGLGLAVASRIVEAHRGRIEVESEVGQGTIFTVVLPLAAKPEAESQQTGEGSQKAEAASWKSDTGGAPGS